MSEETSITDFEVTVDSTTLKRHEDDGEGQKVKLIRVTRDSEGPAQFELVLHQTTKEQPSKYPGVDYQIGAKVKIKLGKKEEGIEEIFDGLATRVDAIFPPGTEAPLYRLAGYDRLHLLTRGRYTEHWQDQKYSDIAEAIAGTFGMSGETDPTSETFPHVSMNNESYYAFLQGLAERSGRLLGCEGKKLLFKEASPSSAVPTLTYGDNLTRARFTSSSAGQINGVWVLGYDPEQAKQVIGKATSGDIGVTKGGSEWGADLVDSKFAEGPDRKNQLWITDVPVSTQAAADDFAKSILNSHAEQFSRVEAECDGDVAIQPHTTVEFKQVTKVFEGDWYVVAATHEMSVAKGFRTRFTARRGAWSPPT